MYHRDFVSIRASVMARSSLLLARTILQRPNSSEEDFERDPDSLTAIRLSNELYRPSSILSRKYASSHLSSVAVLLEVFLERQALLARDQRPPSPRPDPVAVQVQQPQTPQKPGLLSIPNGVLTPPITPDGDATFVGTRMPKTDNPPAHHCPSTPTSILGDDFHDGSMLDEHDDGGGHQEGILQSY